jgi:LmbE family N-acetylglucosaminyl deacetylase
MLKFVPESSPSRPLRLLCIGAHSDDIEIGSAGTLLTWSAAGATLNVTWVVLTGGAERQREARRSAQALLRRAQSLRLVFGGFDDGRLPSQTEAVKDFFEHLKTQTSPDLILTHRLEDRHQDHRMIGELTWNTWRDHTILEYEIPKYEGDLGHPNLFVPISEPVMRRKSALLMQHFGSQRSKSWFLPATFEALARIRGIECRSSSGLAEGFHARKIQLAPPAASAP